MEVAGGENDMGREGGGVSHLFHPTLTPGNGSLSLSSNIHLWAVSRGPRSAPGTQRLTYEYGNTFTFT